MVRVCVALLASMACSAAGQVQLQTKRDASDPDSYIPAQGSLNWGTPACKDVVDLNYTTPYTGSKKVLVYCTSKYLLQTTNATKYFNTGHHSTEFLLMIHHFIQAGFSHFDLVTKDGGAVEIEDWTFALAPAYQDKLTAARTALGTKLSTPKKSSDIDVGLSDYLAVFAPGGHGPLIEGHTDEAFGAILRAAHSMSLPTISLCHGPNVFRSAALGGTFPYSGYSIVVFPDAADDPNYYWIPASLKPENAAEAQLIALGMLVMNNKSGTVGYPQSEALNDQTHVDREVITGQSQAATQKLAKVALDILIEKYVTATLASKGDRFILSTSLFMFMAVGSLCRDT